MSAQERVTPKRLAAVLVGMALFTALAAASYKVEPGDTLSNIAEANGVSTAALAEANGIVDFDLIYVGQTLQIPGKTAASPTSSYTVKVGDRLADIARSHNVTISALAQANGIDDIDLIRIGQVLNLPGRAPAASAASTDSYRVAAGDALSLIAARYGVTTDQLASANGIADADRIRVGQVLDIPGAPTPAPAPAPAPSPAPQPAPAPAPPQVLTYTVAAGDALSIIARDNGITTQALAEANGIDDPAKIFVGQELEIPKAAAPATPAAPASGSSPAPTPAAAPPPVPTRDDPQVVTEETYYQVKVGDTLSTIAERFINMTADDIAYANGLEPGASLQAGSTLLIPVLERNLRGVVPDDAFKANNQAFHTVAEGETMTSIAQRYGVDVNEMANINGIGDIRYVAVGHVLEIPKNRWVCPLPDSIFINDWGFPRPGGRTHEGNDLFAPIGTPVLAPVSGSLTTKEGPIGGLQFNLMGDDGVLYIGTHLSKYGEAGQVSAGTIIGYVGDTGNAAGAKPHLHFEMHPGAGDNPVNPYPTLVRACR